MKQTHVEVKVLGMKILAIDTSGPVCSAAVALDGRIAAEIKLDMGRTHSTQIMPAIDAVLSMSDTSLGDLDYLAVTVGPGSFTGLRIGIATAQGLAVATGLKVVALSSLAVMAEAYRSLDQAVLPMIDARNKRAFIGLWKNDQVLLEEDLISLEECAVRILQIEEEKRPRTIIVSGDASTVAEIWPPFSERLEDAGISLHYTRDRAPLAGAAAELALRLLEEKPDSAVDASLLSASYLSLTSAEKQLGIEV